MTMCQLPLAFIMHCMDDPQGLPLQIDACKASPQGHRAIQVLAFAAAPFEASFMMRPALLL